MMMRRMDRPLISDMIQPHEDFSWRGFTTGAVLLAVLLITQSVISFPSIWSVHPFAFTLYILFSCLIVGITSGGVLVYLFPPAQDVIGIAGLGSDNASQHVALTLTVLALMQPMVSGFILFYDYFANDPFIPIWILIAFLIPSAGLTLAMYERTNSIASELRDYFKDHERLDLVSLTWLHGLGPRTAAYRMGMLESAVSKIKGLGLKGYEIVKDSSFEIK